MRWRCVPRQSCPTHSRNSATALLLGQSVTLDISSVHRLRYKYINLTANDMIRGLPVNFGYVTHQKIILFYETRGFRRLHTVGLYISQMSPVYMFALYCVPFTVLSPYPRLKFITSSHPWSFSTRRFYVFILPVPSIYKVEAPRFQDIQHRPPLPPRKYSWYSFLLEIESVPGP